MTICRWFGHDFVALKTVNEHSRSGKFDSIMFTAEELRRLMTFTTETYHGVVCRRCGVAPSGLSTDSARGA